MRVERNRVGPCNFSLLVPGEQITAARFIGERIPIMYLSGCPISKAEAARWVRNGIQLSVIDPTTKRPIRQGEGKVQVDCHGWKGVVTLVNGIVAKVE